MILKQLLPILADIANGIFAVLMASYLYGNEVQWWYFLIGIVFAMSPDLDALPELFRNGKVAASSKHVHDHRELMHYPIIFVFVGILLIQLNVYVGTVFLIATILHFVNDFYGTGWGISIFWPITKRRYKLLGRRSNRLKKILIEDGDWESLTHDERRLRLVVSWSNVELDEYVGRWGVEDWIDRYYCKSNWISVTEYMIFVASVILMLITLIY